MPENPGHKKPEPANKLLKAFPLIILSSLIVIVIASMTGVYLYSSNQKKVATEFLNNNFEAYKKSVDKTIQVFNQYDKENQDTQVKVDKLKDDLNLTKNEVNNQKNILKTTVPDKYTKWNQDILVEFNSLNELNDNTILYLDLSWCITPEYTKFTELSSQATQINKDSKPVDTFVNIKNRFDKLTIITLGMQEKIENSLKCFEKYPVSAIASDSAFISNITQEKDRYKKYVEIYKQISQAAEQEDNTRMLAASKNLDLFYSVYFEKSIQSLASTLDSNLRSQAKNIENNLEILKTSKDQYLKSL